MAHSADTLLATGIKVTGPNSFACHIPATKPILITTTAPAANLFYNLHHSQPDRRP